MKGGRTRAQRDEEDGSGKGHSQAGAGALGTMGISPLLDQSTSEAAANFSTGRRVKSARLRWVSFLSLYGEGEGEESQQK